MTIATKSIADSVILATLLELLALPSCSRAQNKTEQAPEAKTEALQMSADATVMAYKVLVA